MSPPQMQPPGSGMVPGMAQSYQPQPMPPQNPTVQQNPAPPRVGGPQTPPPSAQVLMPPQQQMPQQMRPMQPPQARPQPMRPILRQQPINQQQAQTMVAMRHLHGMRGRNQQPPPQVMP